MSSCFIIILLLLLLYSNAFLPSGPDEESLRQARLAALGNRSQEQPIGDRQTEDRKQPSEPKPSKMISGDKPSELRKRNTKSQLEESVTLTKNTKSKPPDLETTQYAKPKKNEEGLHEARLAALREREQQREFHIWEKQHKHAEKKSEPEDPASGTLTVEDGPDQSEHSEKVESDLVSDGEWQALNSDASVLPNQGSTLSQRPEQLDLPHSGSEEDPSSMLRGSASTEGQVSPQSTTPRKSPAKRDSPSVPKHPDLQGEELMLYVLSQMFNIKVVSTENHLLLLK